MLHGKFEGGVSYSAVWNLLGFHYNYLVLSDLDYPCGAFPVTFADPEKDPKLASYIPISETDKSTCEKCISFEVKLTIDDPEKYKGGPVGLQLIGRRFEEEKILDMVEIIAQAIGKVE